MITLQISIVPRREQIHKHITMKRSAINKTHLVTEVSREELLTKRQLAPRLRCSARTLDEWMKRGRIPYIKLGKTVRFRWADVVSKLNQYRVN